MLELYRWLLEETTSPPSQLAVGKSTVSEDSPESLRGLCTYLGP